MDNFSENGFLGKNLFLLAVGVFFTSFNLFAELPLKPESGELYRIELAAEHVKRLEVFGVGNGLEKVFSEPGDSIHLPEGEYVIEEFSLENGFSNHYLSKLRFKAGKDAPNEIKAGHELKAVIDAERKGSFLILRYGIKDSQGNVWQQERTENPPSFTVYKGGVKIVSHDFQYG